MAVECEWVHNKIIIGAFVLEQMQQNLQNTQYQALIFYISALSLCHTVCIGQELGCCRDTILFPSKKRLSYALYSFFLV